MFGSSSDANWQELQQEILTWQEAPITEYQTSLSTEQFLSHISSFTPFVIRGQENWITDKSDINTEVTKLVNDLRTNHKEVDISCEDIGNIFKGDSFSREKIDMKLSSFVEGFESLRLHGKGTHWTHNTGLNLFLSQASYFIREANNQDNNKFSESSSSSSSSLGTVSIPNIAKDICLPKYLQLSFQTEYQLQQANVWMNYFDSTTNLHYDSYNNLLQVRYGKKKILLISSEYTSQLYPNAMSSVVTQNHSKIPSELLLNELMTKEFMRSYTDNKFRLLNSVGSAVQYHLVEVDESTLLFLPEGWWHFVVSSPCTLAINHWFDSPISKLFSGKVNLREYLFRTSFCELLQNEMQNLATEVSILSTKLAQSHSAVINTRKRKLASNMDDQDSADDNAIESDCVYCMFARFHILIQALLTEQTSCNTQGIDTSGFVSCSSSDQKQALESNLTKLEKQFISIPYEDASWLWPTFAHENPVQWTQLLLQLSSSATYILTNQWDVCGVAEEKEQAKESVVETRVGNNPVTDTACRQHNISSKRPSLIRASNLEDFFRLIFHPCGDKGVEVRRHLFDSIDHMSKLKSIQILRERIQAWK